MPIHNELLHVVLKYTDIYYGTQPYLAVMYKALFSTMYFGLFIIGELTSGSHPVTAKDIHIAENKNKMMFILHTSKTHWKDKKLQIIKINSNVYTPTGHRSLSLNKAIINKYCPFKLLRSYVEKRGGYYSLNEPFFVFSDKSPVQPNHARRILSIVLKLAKFNHTNYSTLGFRAGQASDLSKLGLSVETIKKLGRWKSNAVFTYLR